jgi:hypothetical protein
MSTADYLARGIHSLTAKLGLTTINQNLNDPTIQAVNDHAAILDAAALIVAAPATATSTGKPGQIAYDATHFYVCIAVNTWVRATLATF